MVIAFGQTMCGFDLLRSAGTSYVCDVNGWAFVKDSAKFWSDSANLLRQCCLSSIAPDHLDRFPVGEMPPGPSELFSSPSLFSEESQIQPLEPPVGSDASELLCVIAISRHGDRTPKQKLKLRTREPSLLSLIIEAAGEPRAEIKIKKIKHMEQARALWVVRSAPQCFRRDDLVGQPCTDAPRSHVPRRRSCSGGSTRWSKRSSRPAKTRRTTRARTSRSYAPCAR